MADLKECQVTTSTSTTSTFTTSATTAVATATTIVAVCDPANNYGLLYDSGGASTAFGTDFHTESVPDAKTAKDCCIACFSTKGCYDFAFYATTSGPTCGVSYYRYYLGTDGPNPYNPTCPHGNTPVYDFQDDPNNGVAPYLGLGPCVTMS